jgi:hypothetical protein
VTQAKRQGRSGGRYYVAPCHCCESKKPPRIWEVFSPDGRPTLISLMDKDLVKCFCIVLNQEMEIVRQLRRESSAKHG